MPGSQRFGNSGRVVHETIDGETILIHLKTGSYFSLDGAGAVAWELLVAGVVPAAVVDALTSSYEADSTAIADAVLALVAELSAEGLIEPAPDGVVNGHVAASAVAAGQPLAGFEVPILRKYTDMQEFLLVDPIHETDDTGWPNAAPAEHG